MCFSLMLINIFMMYINKCIVVLLNIFIDGLEGTNVYDFCFGFYKREETSNLYI